MTGYFITGTDTDVGKTLLAHALIQHLVGQGKRVIGMKPVAAGLIATPQGEMNPDVAQLRAASNVAAPLELINPYSFSAAIAPHIAAQVQQDEIDLQQILIAYQALRARAEIVVVEGAGGFCVPLNANHTMANLAQTLNLPIVLVVGMRLGCLNHALLSVEAITQRGLKLAGWVANTLAVPMPYLHENVETLRARIDAPLWGLIPVLKSQDPALGSEFEPHDWSTQMHFPSA